MLPAPEELKPQPVSPAWVATVTPPGPVANVNTVEYTADGQQLCIVAAPSGMIQFWDVEQRNESFRIEPPRGNRNPWWGQPQLTADGTMLYLPTENQKATAMEKDGSKVWQIAYQGLIRRWDLTTRTELRPFVPPKGRGNVYAELVPGGRLLLSVERLDKLTTDPDTVATVFWDTQTGQRFEWANGFVTPRYSADGRRMVHTVADEQTQTSIVRLYALPERQLVREQRYEARDGHMLFAKGFSPDGRRLVGISGGTATAPLRLIVLDAQTLAQQGEWTLPACGTVTVPDEARFTPDSQRFLVVDDQNELHISNLATQRVERRVKLGAMRSRRLAVRPDGRWLAVAGTPQLNPNIPDSSDPQDLPQPRIMLIDLVDAQAQPITLIAPQGPVGGLAFRPDGRQLAFGSSGGVHLFDLTQVIDSMKVNDPVKARDPVKASDPGKTLPDPQK